MQRQTVERLIRGGGGSSLVHGALIALLFVPLPAPKLPETGSQPRFSFSQQATRSAPVVRRPDPPFRDNPPSSGSGVSLSLENGPNGADFVIDLERIRSRRNDLFPFVTWELPFLRERPGLDDGKGLGFVTTLRELPPSGGPPLMLTPEQVQSVVDRAWSRRNRWENLQELIALTERYHPDRGDLATVFREYLRQNVPQPYDDWSDADPVYWITLMLASDDAPLVEFVGRFSQRHPASRVTTELLFLLEGSAETSCDVLLRVLSVGSPELPLRVTRLDNPEAYDLASSLMVTYRSWAARHEARLPEACLLTRIDALRRIIDTSPESYGVADARFRLGQLLWLAGRRPEAIEWWSAMVPDARDQYAVVRRALLGAIADGAADANPGRITGILRDEDMRWRIAARERLDHFGTRSTEF